MKANTTVAVIDKLSSVELRKGYSVQVCSDMQLYFIVVMIIHVRYLRPKTESLIPDKTCIKGKQSQDLYLGEWMTWLCNHGTVMKLTRECLV